MFLAKNVETNKQMVAKEIYYKVEIVRKEMEILEKLEHVSRHSPAWSFTLANSAKLRF